ncbi:MAG: hypothetical protein KDM63_21185 [Verrucomicrobiae bacterium]|nr:hypothetical protein [Verrucomicrobiae bacterium]
MAAETPPEPLLATLLGWHCTGDLPLALSLSQTQTPSPPPRADSNSNSPSTPEQWTADRLLGKPDSGRAIRAQISLDLAAPPTEPSSLADPTLSDRRESAPMGPKWAILTRKRPVLAKNGPRITPKTGFLTTKIIFVVKTGVCVMTIGFNVIKIGADVMTTVSNVIKTEAGVMTTGSNGIKTGADIMTKGAFLMAFRLRLGKGRSVPLS